MKRSCLPILIFFLTFVSTLSAQDAFIFGDEFLCPGQCGTWDVEFPQSETLTYTWQITDGSAPSPDQNNIFYEITTEGYQPLFWCEVPFSGSFVIFLTVTEPGGTGVVSTGEFQFFVDGDEQFFGEAYGFHTTECEQDSFTINLPGGLEECYEVCVGTTSTLSMQTIIIDSPNGEIITIDPSQGNWSVTGGTVQPVVTGGDDNFNLGTLYASPGQTVCVPVTVNSFDNIISAGFDINYNASVLDYIGIENMNMSFPLSATVPNPGTVSLNGSLPIGGATLPDNTVLLEVCFQVVGSTSSSLTFSQGQVLDGNGNTIDFSGSSGAVILGAPPSSDISILWEEEGSGFAYYNFWYTNFNGCEVFGSIDFCFDVFPPPPADFTTEPQISENGLLEICEGQTVFFDSEATDADAYLWDFGDGGGSSLPDPQYTFTAAGTYDIQLITSSGCECSDTSRLTVVVEGNDAPFVDCVATICEGTSVTYTANTGCSSYAWDISANGTILDGGGSADDFITIQWGAGPIGEITLETDGCPDLSTCTEAAYLQVPIVSASTTITGPTEVCRGDQTVYSVPPFQGTEFNWSVTSFGTIIAGQGTPSVTIEWFDGFIPSGAQVVSVDYANCYLECGGSAQMDVFVRPEFYLTGGISICENETADYNVVNDQTNTGFPANFTVLASDGSVVWTSPSAGSTFPITWNFGAGSFTLVATPQNSADFCTTLAEMPVNVIPQPAAVTAINGQTDICPGLAYNYSIDAPVDGERYRWTITNGGTVTEREGTTIAVVWNAAGPYQIDVVRLSPPLFCTSAVATLSVGAVSSFAINGDDQVCLDQLAAYTSDQTGDVYYDWSIQPTSAGTISGDPTAADIEVLWHTAGPATVTLDICGQQETFAVTVNAPPQPIVNHPADICAGTTEIVSTSIPFSTYSWQDAEGNELSTSSTPDLGGGYYRLVVTDAIGCVGRTTFQIYEFPMSEISISTPDFTLFCGIPPFSRLYAVDTEDGYAYQWYQDGTALAGETGSNYTATVFGNYHVDIIDENGCAFSSNTILVAEDCISIGGTNGGASCNNPNHTFTVTENGACDDRAYTAIATGSTPGSIFWSFDDPDSGAANNATGANVTHQYTKPGFYRVLMAATYDDGIGGQVLCRDIIPDTVFAVAAFDYDGVCPGAPVQFYDLTTFIDLANLVSWEWNFGDPTSGADNTSTDKDPVHTFSGGGDYEVTLVVTTDVGCTTTLTKTVSIYPLPFTNFAEPDVTCALTALEFIADVEATVSEVNWDYGDAASGDANTSTLFTSYHQYASPGTYLVTLEATSIYGCMNSFDRNVTITPNPLNGEIDPQGVSTLCEGDELTLTAPGGSAVAWQWSTTEDTQTITIGEAGAYSVELTSAEGCTYSPQSAILDIIPAPQSPIRSVTYNDFNQPTEYTYDTLYVCFGEDIFLETETTIGYTYVWSNGDVGPETEYTEDRGNLLPAGDYVITMDVTDTSTGCSATESFVIIVNPTPDIPVLDAGGAGALCAGTAATIMVDNPQANVIFFWSNGEVGPTITTDEAGEYYVTSVNIYGCSSESEVTEILEGPDVSLVPSGCHTRCAPDTLCLPSIPNVVSYQWYQDGVLLPAPEGTIPNLIVDESASYTLEMEDANGCVQISDPLNIDLLPGFGTISGVVYYDLNDNEMIDAGDGPAENIEVEIVGALGLQDEIVTPVDGTYGFVDVPEDDYTLMIDAATVPATWIAQIASIDTTFTGCDQEITINWLLIKDCETDSTFTANICEGEDYLFRGLTYAIGTTNTVQITSADGCDSTFTFTVAGLPSSSEIIGAEVCAGEMFSYQGVDYGAGTDELFTFTNSAGCDSTIQLQVVAAPEAEFSLIAEESCQGTPTGSVTVNPTTGATPFVYALDAGSFQADAIFANLESGTYDLTVEDANGCQYTEAFMVDALPGLIVKVDNVTLPCDSAAIQLVPEIISGDDGSLVFNWSDGPTTLARPVGTPGLLQLQVSNACETVLLPVTVDAEVAAEGQLIYVPNAFSPNNDGANDGFRIYPHPEVQVETLDFQVYDRWGSQLFDAANWDDEWGGISRGRNAASGVYIWQLTAKINLCGQMVDIVQQGEVILVR